MNPGKKNKTCIIIAGPTAVGKTAVSIELAKHFKTSIISADSRQCYKEMKIGVARPSEEELAAVKHYFIASHSIHEEVNVKTFEAYALDSVNEIFKENDVAIIVGGTGLYIRAFAEGIDHIPGIKEEVRSFVRTGYKENGIAWLQQQLEAKDTAFMQVGETYNPARLMRALEVVLSTGHSILTHQRGNIAARDFNIIKIGLGLDKELLHRNINTRVDQMIEDGLVEEVRALLPYRELKALQTVGYAEVFEYLDGKVSLEQAMEEIKKNTRQYAKRQMTWFRKEEGMDWIETDVLMKNKDHIIKILLLKMKF